MRIKDNKGKKIETIFLISASIITIALVAYVITLVRRVVARADVVFQIDQNVTSGIPVFNFDKYEKLFGPISSSTASSTTASSSTQGVK